MEQTPRRDVPCLGISEALRAPVIALASAVTVPQKGPAAQAAAAAGIARQACGYGETTPMTPEDDHGTPSLLRLATSRWVQYK
jgi:hypothetical protein